MPVANQSELQPLLERRVGELRGVLLLPLLGGRAHARRRAAGAAGAAGGAGAAGAGAVGGRMLHAGEGADQAGAVDADVGELLEVREGDVQRLAAAHREAGDGACSRGP